MGASVDYLTQDRKTGRLWYRRVYPPALRSFIPPPNTQMRRSLGSRRIDEPGVMDKFREAAADYDRTVLLATKAASGKFDAIDAPTIAFLAETYRVGQLASDEDARWSPERSTAFVAIKRPGGGVTRAVNTEARAERDLTFFKSLRGRADLGGIVTEWGAAVEALAASKGYCFDRSDPAYPQLCRAINDAAILACGTVLDRLGGEVLPTPPEPLHPARPQAPLARDAAPASPVATFEAIAEGLLTNVRAPASATTRQGSRTALRLLRGALGPITPEGLTRLAVT